MLLLHDMSRWSFWYLSPFGNGCHLPPYHTLPWIYGWLPFLLSWLSLQARAQRVGMGGILVLGARLITVLLKLGIQRVHRDREMAALGQTGFLRLNCVGEDKLLVDHAATHSFRGTQRGLRVVGGLGKNLVLPLYRNQILRDNIFWMRTEKRTTDGPNIVPDEKS